MGSNRSGSVFRTSPLRATSGVDWSQLSHETDCVFLDPTVTTKNSQAQPTGLTDATLQLGRNDAERQRLHYTRLN